MMMMVSVVVLDMSHHCHLSSFALSSHDSTEENTAKEGSNNNQGDLPGI